MSETHGTSPSRVLIFTRDGRTLCAYSGIALCIARLMRDDLRHWLVGSRSVEYRNEGGETVSLAGEEVAAIEIMVDDPDA